MTDEALDTVIDIFSDTTGIRDLEQAAEHIVANALYQIEVDHLKQVVFTGVNGKRIASITLIHNFDSLCKSQ